MEGIRISFDGRGSNGLLPLRGANSKTTRVMFCHTVFFSAQYHKRYRDNSNGDHFRFQNPKRY